MAEYFLKRRAKLAQIFKYFCDFDVKRRFEGEFPSTPPEWRVVRGKGRMGQWSVVSWQAPDGVFDRAGQVRRYSCRRF
jgi:hypothetical protein